MTDTNRVPARSGDAEPFGEAADENYALASRAALVMVALPALLALLLSSLDHDAAAWLLEAGETAILATGGVPLVFSAGAALWWGVATAERLLRHRRPT